MTKEERNLAKMVMPKKKKRLLEKIEYSKRKKASQVKTATEKYAKKHPFSTFLRNPLLLPPLFITTATKVTLLCECVLSLFALRTGEETAGEKKSY